MMIHLGVKLLVVKKKKEIKTSFQINDTPSLLPSSTTLIQVYIYESHLFEQPPNSTYRYMVDESSADDDSCGQPTLQRYS